MEWSVKCKQSKCNLQTENWNQKNQKDQHQVHHNSFVPPLEPMQALVPPFVWSLRFSTPAVPDEKLFFESYYQFFNVDPEEDYSELSLLKEATQQRSTLTVMLLEAAQKQETLLTQLTPGCQPASSLPSTTSTSVNNTPAQKQAFESLVVAIDEYLSTLLSVFALLNEVQSNTISSTSSTSGSFSMSSLSSALQSSTNVDNKDDFGVVRRPGVGCKNLFLALAFFARYLILLNLAFNITFLYFSYRLHLVNNFFQFIRVFDASWRPEQELGR